jgi:hypothetical protein
VDHRAHGQGEEQAGHNLKVLAWEGLKTAGEFDPTCLHLDEVQVVA